MLHACFRRAPFKTALNWPPPFLYYYFLRSEKHTNKPFPSDLLVRIVIFSLFTAAEGVLYRNPPASFLLLLLVLVLLLVIRLLA